LHLPRNRKLPSLFCLKLIFATKGSAFFVVYRNAGGGFFPSTPQKRLHTLTRVVFQ